MTDREREQVCEYAERYDTGGGRPSNILAARCLALLAELKKERGLKMDALLRAEKAERLMYHYQSLLGERGLL